MLAAEPLVLDLQRLHALRLLIHIPPQTLDLRVAQLHLRAGHLPHGLQNALPLLTTAGDLSAVARGLRAHMVSDNTNHCGQHAAKRCDKRYCDRLHTSITILQDTRLVGVCSAKTPDGQCRDTGVADSGNRSEERRVGKKSRARW